MEKKYVFNDFSLFNIRNRNELHVISLLGEVLKEFPGYDPKQFDIEDIYALALNKLPPQYIQQGSIVLKFRQRVDDNQIREALRAAIKTVKEHPTVE